MRYYRDYQHYRTAWEDAFRSTPPIPLNIDIELSATCNLRCGFCFLQDPKYQTIKHTPSMPHHLAVEAIYQAYTLGVPAIKLNWRGESTLHPKFTKITELAASFEFHEIICNTNGNCPEEAIDGLMACTKVIFSLDSMDKGQYESMRKGGKIRDIMRTINILIEKGHKNIHVRRVITKENQDEDFVQIAKSAWKSFVNVSEHYCMDRNSDKKMQLSSKNQKARTYCGYPSQRLVVASNGDIFPCCVDYFGEMKLGNIQYNSLYEVWNSKKLNSLRRNLKINNQGEWSNQCKNCTSWMAYESNEKEKLNA